MICTSSPRYACLASLVAALGACSDKPTSVATLSEWHGPVDRQGGEHGNWEHVQLGAAFYVHDGARTIAGDATLEVAGGRARVVMASDTKLLFRGTPSNLQLIVEGNGIAVTRRDGKSLRDGASLEISPRRAGRETIELTINGNQLAHDGETFELVVDPADAERRRDAGVPDARPPVNAALDAAVDAAADAAEAVGDAMIEVTGRRAELLAPGETTWKPLPQGAGQLARGSSVRVGAGTTARLTAAGTTLELAGGSRATLRDDRTFSIDSGSGQASATAATSIALPGGTLALAGAAGAPAEARLDGNARETKVTMVRGGARLTGTAGADLTLSRGESASLGRAGTIRVVEAIPRFFDLRVVVGESLTIHDPKPPAAVQLQFDGKCPDGGIIEIDRDARFRTARVSAGRDFANAMIAAGGWSYRLRCTTSGAEGSAVASGRVTVVRDDGRRPLPRAQVVNDIDADGRNYRISYQSAIPSVAIHVKNPGASHKLHLASAGKEQTFDSTTPAIVVPGNQLREGTYTYWIDRDGVKQDKVSTLTIDFDQTAPQVYLEAPLNGQAWSGDIDVRGAVLPGWSAAVGDIAIPIDRQRRFAATVGAPGGNALAIKLSHPQRGVHYYLRRSK